MAWWSRGRHRSNSKKSEVPIVPRSNDIEDRKSEALNLLQASQDALGTVEDMDQRVREVQSSLRKIKRENHFATLMYNAIKGS